MSMHDALTDLSNRSLFRDRLEQAIAHATRERRSLAVAVVDIDRFKELNDALGSENGDRLLHEAGARLGKAVRTGDTVARGSGDEFLVLLPGLAHAEDAVRAADRLMAAFEGAWRLDGQTLWVTPSIGLAVFPADGAMAETLLSNADTAMHRAKQRGRNVYSFFDAPMNRALASRLALESELHQAIDQHEFVVHYQPIIEIATGAVVGVEALARWLHPERGLLMPAAFMEAAEDTGLVVAMGQQVLEAACHQVKSWQKNGTSALSVAVNLSLRQFQTGDLVGAVSDALQDSALEPGCLDLEITETLAMRDPERTGDVLERLGGLGAGLALDDFGTGYSSLSHLQALPIDILKIDRSFVSGVETDASAAAIVATVIAMGRELGLTLVAEGVETESQLAFLRERGCDRMQGYLVSRPLPADDCAALIAEGAVTL